MDKASKSFWTIWLICIAVGVLGGIYLISPFYIEETKEIWLPNHYQIVNKIGGSYVSIPDYINENASLMQFKVAKGHYNEGKFSDDNFDIFVLVNGTVWYVWEHDGILQKTSESYAPFMGGHDRSVINITADDKIIVAYKGAGLLLLACILIGVVGGLGLGCLIAKCIDSSWQSDS